VVQLGLTAPASVEDWKAYRAREVWLGDTSSGVSAAQAAKSRKAVEKVADAWRAVDARSRRAGPQWPQWVVDGRVRPDSVVGLQEGDVYIGRMDKKVVVWWDGDRGLWVEEELAGKTEAEDGRWEEARWTVVSEDGPY
jgi:hypothetical protein